MEETIHVTFSEDDESISQSNTKGDAINFNENRSVPNDEFLEPKSKDFVSPEEPPEFTNADNHPALNDLDQPESSDKLEPAEIQDNVTNEPISNVQPSPTISPLAEGKPLAGITIRSRIRDSKDASAHECLYVNFLSEMEPKKLIETLKEEGWIIVMQDVSLTIL
ncbi:hypothetical protein Tco_0110588 [Tanacetum coccineum]